MRLALLLLTLLPCVMASAKPVPTVYSTDIGGDIDDTWALVQVLRSPELDLKMVFTDAGIATYRGKIAARILEIAWRTDVDVALGADGAHEGPQAAWVKDYDLAAYPGTVHTDGPQAFIDFVRASGETVHVVAVGPCPSLAETLTREPDIARKCRFFGMYGSFDRGYGGRPTPDAETNVRSDVEALRTVLQAPWKSITLTPLDTCGVTDLRGENYARIWCSMDDPLLRALIENYCYWAPLVTWMNCDFFTRRSTTLFDGVAVHMAHSDDYLEFEDIAFHITDDGFTRRDPDGPHRARVAIRWRDRQAFEADLTRRLLGADASVAGHSEREGPIKPAWRKSGSPRRAGSPGPQ